MRNEVPKFSKNILEASEGLNLKRHYVINGKSKQGELKRILWFIVSSFFSSKGELEIASCVDLEGHKGSDSRFYLLDFSRTFPPAFKDSELREAHDKYWPYYHMLRSESVLKSQHALSADAFSNFNSRGGESKENNREVRAVTEQVKTEGVMRVCKTLMDYFAAGKSLSFSHIFHQNGLNMRYLGLVYSQITSHSMYDGAHSNLYILILVESMMRVLKNYIRSRLRQEQASSNKQDCESRLLTETANILNRFFAGVVSCAFGLSLFI